MIVCICNCIKDKQIDSVLSEGISSPCDVFRRLGCAPVCGKCVPEIRESFHNHRETCVTQ